MPLIPGICTQCGSTLSVDKEKDAMVCPYCNTAFVVEKAIQNFNNTYNIVNNITAENVYVQSANNEFEIVAGVLKKYHGQALEVVVPDGVIEIGESAFQGLCVTSIILPNSVKVIRSSAFAGTKMTAFVMPNSVEVVDNGVFWGCSKLKTIILSKNLKSIGSGAFNYCKTLEELHFPSSLEYIAYARENKDDSSVILTNSLGEMFDSCENLKAVYFSSETIEKFKKFDIEFHEVDIYIDNKKLEYPDEYVKKFPGSKEYIKHAQFEREERAKQYAMLNGLCPYCGGKFGGLFEKRCKKCNKVKNY